MTFSLFSTIILEDALTTVSTPLADFEFLLMETFSIHFLANPFFSFGRICFLLLKKTLDFINFSLNRICFILAVPLNASTCHDAKLTILKNLKYVFIRVATRLDPKSKL